MRRGRVTVMRKACCKDWMERYENPIENACDMEEGHVFTSAAERPLHGERPGDRGGFHGMDCARTQWFRKSLWYKEEVSHG